MINNRFEAYKLKRELKRSGVNYDFLRAGKNEYCEPDGEYKIVGTITGLYHESSSHISLTMSGTTNIRTKKVPSILCLYEDAAAIKLSIGDRVVINEKIMNVTGVVDIQEWGIISDISLEVIDDGN